MPPTPADNLAAERQRELLDALRATVDAVAGRTFSPRIKLLSIEDVCAAMGVGKSKVYEMVEAGTFPKPIAGLGAKMNRWRESTLIAWLDAHDPNRGAA